jgi:membrane protease YdiL (CAAX protease family)
MSEPPPPPPSPQASVPPPPPPSQPPAPPLPQRRGILRNPVGLPYIEWTPLTVLLGTLTAIGIMILGTVPIAIFDPEIESAAGKDVAQLMVGVALIAGALIFAVIDAGGKLREALTRLGFRGLAGRVIGIAVIAWLIYLVCALVLAPILSPHQEDVTKEVGTDTGGALNVIVGAILIVIIAPLSEEVFFRGFMFAGLRRAMPLWGAALISACVWGSLHLTGGNVGVAIQLAVFGVILAYLYEQTGSLYATIFAHALNNTIAFIYLVTS